MENTGTNVNKKIGICGRGGSGKSTVTVFLARALCERGYDVCVLDADSSNLGIATALGVDREPEPLLDYFGGMVFSGGSVTCPVDDPTSLAHATVSLEELPPRYWSATADGVLLLTAGKMGSLGSGSGCDGPIAKIARDLRIRATGSNSILLVDFKAGLEDPARGVITGLDWALTVVDPTLPAIRLALEMQNMVEWLKAGQPPATRHLDRPELVRVALRNYRDARIEQVSVVLNKIRDSQTENLIRRGLTEEKIQPIGALRESDAVSQAWLEGTPLTAWKVLDDARRLARDLECEITRASEAHAIAN